MWHTCSMKQDMAMIDHNYVGPFGWEGWWGWGANLIRIIEQVYCTLHTQMHFPPLYIQYVSQACMCRSVGYS